MYELVVRSPVTPNNSKNHPTANARKLSKKHQSPFSAKLKNNKGSFFRGNKKAQKPLASGLQIIKPE
jgi:hypothetical protein